MSLPIRRSLPLRGQAEEVRPSGPKPFSREWVNLTPEQQAGPPRRRLGRPAGGPAWLPSERVLTIFVVAMLVLTSTIIQTGWAPSVAGVDSPGAAGNPRVEGVGRLLEPTATPSVVVPAVATEPPADRVDPTEPPAATGTTEPTPEDETSGGDGGISLDGDGAGGQTEEKPATATAAPPADEPETGTADMVGALLPDYRILAYYGHPHDENMGILGQFDMDELLAQLLDEAATYEAADPSRPIMPAFEVIASVAQNTPMSDNSWLGYTDDATIKKYIDFTAENDIILILDIQIGYTSVKADMRRIEKFLRYPNVHLAIDPEFSLKDGEIPGEVIGGVDADEVTYAQNRLAKISASEGIPPKVLIVHRFRHGMIRDDDRVKPVEGVQLVIDMDGFGNPGLKIESYKIFITDKDPEYGGIKVFYDQDEPVMTAEEVIGLDPSPDYVMYQ